MMGEMESLGKKKQANWGLLIALVVTCGVFLIASITFAILFLAKDKEVKACVAEADSLTAALQSTQEGKKALEEANNSLKNQKTELGAKVDEAEKNAQEAQNDADSAKKGEAAAKKGEEAAKLTASQAEKKLEQTKKELSEKLKEVEAVNNQLSDKKAELDKANRGIAMFGELKQEFNRFDRASAEFSQAIDYCYQGILNNDNSLFQYYYDQLDGILDTLLDSEEKIINLFDQIEKGQY